MNEMLLPQSVATLEALLRVVAEPEKHAAALAALKKHSDTAQAALANAQKAQRDAELLHKQLDEKRADLASYENDLHSRADALDRDIRDLKERENNLAAARTEHARAMDDLAVATHAHEQREIDLDAREGAAAEKELHAARLHAEAETLRRDWERRIAKLKELAG